MLVKREQDLQTNDPMYSGEGSLYPSRLLEFYLDSGLFLERPPDFSINPMDCLLTTFGFSLVVQNAFIRNLEPSANYFRKGSSFLG